MAKHMWGLWRWGILGKLGEGHVSMLCGSMILLVIKPNTFVNFSFKNGKVMNAAAKSSGSSSHEAIAASRNCILLCCSLLWIQEKKENSFENNLAPPVLTASQATCVCGISCNAHNSVPNLMGKLWRWQECCQELGQLYGRKLKA